VSACVERSSSSARLLVAAHRHFIWRARPRLLLPCTARSLAGRHPPSLRPCHHEVLSAAVRSTHDQLRPPPAALRSCASGAGDSAVGGFISHRDDTLIVAFLLSRGRQGAAADQVPPVARMACSLVWLASSRIPNAMLYNAAKACRTTGDGKRSRWVSVIWLCSANRLWPAGLRGLHLARHPFGLASVPRSSGGGGERGRAGGGGRGGIHDPLIGHALPLRRSPPWPPSRQRLARAPLCSPRFQSVAVGQAPCVLIALAASASPCCRSARVPAGALARRDPPAVDQQWRQNRSAEVVAPHKGRPTQQRLHCTQKRGVMNTPRRWGTGAPSQGW